MRGLGGPVGIALSGSGSALPRLSVSNDDLSGWLDTSDSWIRSRTGIAARRIAAGDETLTVLATRASRQALEAAGWTPLQLELILLATSSPDDLFGTAPQIQAALGADNAVAFDLTAACSGFLFALITAAQYIRTGCYRRVLVVGVDLLSRWVDWHDRSIAVLFGDAAAAVTLEACDSDRDGLLAFAMRTDGARNGCLTLPLTPSEQCPRQGISIQQGSYGSIRMNGQEVYKFAVREVPAILAEVLDQAGVDAASLDWLLLHQANQRILDAAAQRFGIPAEKVLSNLAHYGNTSAATIPLMLHEAVAAGRIRPGHLIASSGFGAGLSWGAALLRWGGRQPG
ncbi:MAG: ketoacyl-ACP synthase III [Aphanocapsa feldmannii 288cV]|nr:MAG: ketoacyl-ACP synthase III [Aphanocapsa feldmannii 288cV]